MTGHPVVSAAFYRVGPTANTPAFPVVTVDAYTGRITVTGSIDKFPWPATAPRAPDGPVWRLRVTAYRTRRGRWRIASQTLEPYGQEVNR